MGFNQDLMGHLSKEQYFFTNNPVEISHYSNPIHFLVVWCTHTLYLIHNTAASLATAIQRRRPPHLILVAFYTLLRAILVGGLNPSEKY